MTDDGRDQWVRDPLKLIDLRTGIVHVHREQSTVSMCSAASYDHTNVQDDTIVTCDECRAEAARRANALLAVIGSPDLLKRLTAFVPDADDNAEAPTGCPCHCNFCGGNADNWYGAAALGRLPVG